MGLKTINWEAGSINERVFTKERQEHIMKDHNGEEKVGSKNAKKRE